MGIKDKLNKLATDDKLKTLSPNGSIYAPNYVVDGAYPTSRLTSVNSPLHADQDGNEGYSLNGAILGEINKLYNAYDDGESNPLPEPSKLDNANNDPKFVSKYNPTKKYEYNHPEFTPKS
jgi:hypothetical protein